MGGVTLDEDVAVAAGATVASIRRALNCWPWDLALPCASADAVALGEGAELILDTAG